MLGRRIIAMSPDKAFAKLLAVALKAAGGTVETHASIDELPPRAPIEAALVVIHVEAGLAAGLDDLVARLAADTKLIAVLPAANLASTVDVMLASDKVAGILIAESFEMTELAAMATRVIAGDIFGLDKVIPWGTQIHSAVVGDYQEKSLAIAQIAELAEVMGVRRKYRESIEQAVDELLMNALYDAPVDDEGKPVFAEIPARSRISLRVERKVVVQYACDGKRFAVSVRDGFGTLERATVLSYLYKCLHSAQQIDRKTGGAGLGLYLIANSASQVIFNVLPGVATEAIVVCGLETPKIQLTSFGYFTEKIDASGRLAAGRSRMLPAGASFPVERRRAADRAPPPRAGTSRGLVAALVLAIAVMLGMIAVVAYPRLFGDRHTAVTFTTDPPGATISIDGRARGVTQGGKLRVDDLVVGKAIVVAATLDGYEPVQTVLEPTPDMPPIPLVLAARSARVHIDSRPPGATVSLGGKSLGATPLTVDTLAPGSTVALVLHKDGYADVTQEVTVPAPGKDATVVVPLAPSSDFASVRLTSEPPGARVFKNGQLLAGVTTPTDDILIEAGKPTTFVLRKDGYVGATLQAKPNAGSRGTTLSATLVPGAAITVKANIDGRFSLDGVAGCRRVPLAVGECVVKPGVYTLLFEGPGGARAVRRIDTTKDQGAIELGFGTVVATEDTTLRLSSGGKSMSRLVLEAGKRTVYVVEGEDGEPTATTVVVEAGKTVTVP